MENRSISEPGISPLSIPYKIKVDSTSGNKAYSFVTGDLEHGIVVDNKGIDKKLYRWVDYNWEREDIPSTISHQVLQIAGDFTTELMVLTKDTSEDIVVNKRTPAGVWSQSSLSLTAVSAVSPVLIDVAVGNDGKSFV